MNNIPTNNLSVRELICIPTDKTYRPVYNRSFELGLNHDSANALQQYFNTAGVANDTNLSIAGVAKELGGVIKLSSLPSGEAKIVNGWGGYRLLYMLAIDEAHTEHTSYTHYIQGYTDYHDPSFSGNLDPNMLFIINSITTVLHSKNVYTNHVSSRVLSTYNVISNASGVSYKLQAVPGESGMGLIRPTDVMTSIYSDAMYAGVTSNVTVVNTAMTLGTVSNKTNNDPVKHFTRTVNAVINGKAMDVGYVTPEATLANANAMVTEEALTSNGFIYALARATGVLESTTFTLGTLATIDPTTPSKVTVVDNTGIFRDVTTHAAILDTLDTADTLEPTIENEVAQTFINSLTSVMSENLLTVFSGVVSNATNAPVTAVSNIRSFLSGVPLDSYGNRVINYINNVIMPLITRNDMLMVEVIFDSNITGDTTVSVSVNSSPYIVYRSPTFADSAYSPVVTDDSVSQCVIDDYAHVVNTVMGMSNNNDQMQF